MKRVIFALMLAMALPAMAQRKMPRRIITPPAEFNLATYNIRLPAGSDSVQGNGWGRRLPYLAGLVRFHEFDIFGTQEGVRHQLDSLRGRLPGYEYIGVGRDNGAEKGSMPLFSMIPENSTLRTMVISGCRKHRKSPRKGGMPHIRVCAHGGVSCIRIPAGSLLCSTSIWTT